MTEQYWNWRFENNPFGKPIIKLAFYEDQLVGNYIANPVQLIHGKKSIPVLHSMTTMTDPDFSGLGISSNLANQVYKMGKNLGFKAVIGYANSKSHDMFIKKLGFFDLKTMNELIINNSQTTSKLIVEEIFDFNEVPKNFCFNIINSFEKFTIKRDNNIQNWRFKSNPENKYHCFKIVDDDEFYGYFVLKIYNGIKCHIVDFLLKDDIDCYNSMLNFSKLFCKKSNLDTLTLWTNYENFLDFLNLKSINIVPQETYFILKMLNEPINNLKDFKNWYVTMSDSDVF